jgi:hypothetical protein
MAREREEAEAKGLRRVREHSGGQLEPENHRVTGRDKGG